MPGLGVCQPTGTSPAPGSAMSYLTSAMPGMVNLVYLRDHSTRLPQHHLTGDPAEVGRMGRSVVPGFAWRLAYISFPRYVQWVVNVSPSYLSVT
jgi:hypothetical protein